MKIGIAADHAGYELKETLKIFLEGLEYEVKDFGAYELNKEDDYPDFIRRAAEAVANGSVERSIVIGSSGQGEAMAANRIKGVRAVVYYGSADPLPSNAKASKPRGIVKDAREDGDVNVLSLAASYVSEDEAKEAVRLWLDTPFSGEERHERRIAKLDSI